jgi:hypothetical protein
MRCLPVREAHDLYGNILTREELSRWGIYYITSKSVISPFTRPSIPPFDEIKYDKTTWACSSNAETRTGHKILVGNRLENGGSEGR